MSLEPEPPEELQRALDDQVGGGRVVRRQGTVGEQVAVPGVQEKLSLIFPDRLDQVARGALLFESCVPVTGDWAFGPWPDGVPVQVHGMDKDPFFALEGDLDAARELVGTIGEDQGQLFLYAGDGHLFTDSSLPSYDSAATDLVVERSLDFLGRIGF